MRSDVLTESQWQDLESVANIKHRVIWAVMRFTGQKVGMVRQLRVGDVYYGTGSVKSEIAFCKNSGRIVVIPVNNRLMEYLRDYRQYAGGYWMFPGADGKFKPINYESVYLYMKNCAERVELEVNVTPHSARRGCLVKLFENGVAPSVVKEVAGVENLRCLREYDSRPIDLRAALACL